MAQVAEKGELAIAARRLPQFPVHSHIALNQEDDFSVTPAWSVIMLGTMLAILQAMDGILTSIGVSRFGLHVEGNPLLRNLMELYGHAPALAITKGLAIFIVIFLTCLAHRVTWVKKALGALNCIYLFFAVLPWTYLLFFTPGL